jgi:hypothetical protein
MYDLKAKKYEFKKVNFQKQIFHFSFLENIFHCILSLVKTSVNNKFLRLTLTYL